MNHINTLVAGRWFGDSPLPRLALPHKARGEFREHADAGEQRAGAWLNADQRGSLASVFAQHFHEPSLGEQPLN